MHPVTIKDVPKFPFIASLPGTAGNIFMLKHNYLLKQLSLLKPQTCMALLLFQFKEKNAQNYKPCKMLLGSYHTPQEMLKLCFIPQSLWDEDVLR